MRFSILFASVLLLAGCGDDDGGRDAGADAATMDGGSDAGGDDAGRDDAGGDDAGGDDAGDDAGGDAGGDAGPTDAGMTSVTIMVDDAQAWANCMPIVPADPLRFFLDLSYDNTDGATDATAVITSAMLTFDDPGGASTSIEFDPASVTIPAGETVNQSHSKTTSDPIVASCAICSSERMMTYDVTVEVDGVPVALNGTIPFGCTF